MLRSRFKRGVHVARDISRHHQCLQCHPRVVHAWIRHRPLDLVAVALPACSEGLEARHGEVLLGHEGTGAFRRPDDVLLQILEVATDLQFVFLPVLKFRNAEGLPGDGCLELQILALRDGTRNHALHGACACGVEVDAMHRVTLAKGHEDAPGRRKQHRSWRQRALLRDVKVLVVIADVMMHVAHAHQTGLLGARAKTGRSHPPLG